MRVFCKIQEFPGIDIDEKLCDSVNWLVQNQRADGALPEVNMVIHREMVVRYAHFILGLISAGFVPLTSQNPYPIIVYSVAIL